MVLDINTTLKAIHSVESLLYRNSTKLEFEREGLGVELQEIYRVTPCLWPGWKSMGFCPSNAGFVVGSETSDMAVNGLGPPLDNKFDANGA